MTGPSCVRQGLPEPPNAQAARETRTTAPRGSGYRTPSGPPGRGEAETAIFKVTQQSRRDSYSALGELMQDMTDQIEQRSADNKSITGPPTGFTKFDTMTAGLQPENLVIMAASPGVGKTSWAVNVAMNAAIRHNVRW